MENNKTEKKLFFVLFKLWIKKKKVRQCEYIIMLAYIHAYNELIFFSKYLLYRHNFTNFFLTNANIFQLKLLINCKNIKIYEKKIKLLIYLI